MALLWLLGFCNVCFAAQIQAQVQAKPQAIPVNAQVGIGLDSQQTVETGDNLQAATTIKDLADRNFKTLVAVAALTTVIWLAPKVLNAFFWG